MNTTTANTATETLVAYATDVFVATAKYDSNIGEGTTWSTVEVDGDNVTFVSTTYSDLNEWSTALSFTENIVCDADGRIIIAESLAAIAEAFAADDAEFSRGSDSDDSRVREIADETGLSEEAVYAAASFERRWVSPTITEDDIR